jgi:hypothetical protein
LGVRSALGTLFAVLVAAAPAHALQASTEQVPLDVRPSQGPSGSSAVLAARGWQAGETIQAYVDGRRTASTTADAAGHAATIVPIPDTTPAPNAIGVHRILLYGAGSHRSAAGTFATTQTGAPRPALLATRGAPDPQDPQVRAGDLLGVNFPPLAPVVLHYQDALHDEHAVTLGRARGDGAFAEPLTWSNDEYGATAVGLSGPQAGDPVLAADALTGASDATWSEPTRRLRALPQVGEAQKPILLLGDGYTPGAALTQTAWDENPSIGLTAGPDGTALGRHDSGPNEDLSNGFRIDEVESGAYGATGAWHQPGTTTPPTAAALATLVAPGTQVTVLGVGFAPNASVTMVGRDAANVASSGGATASGEGIVQATFDVPGGAAPGGYDIRLTGAGGEAHASLAVSGPLAPPPLQIVGELGLVAMPHTAEQRLATREVQVCNDGTTERDVTLTDSDTETGGGDHVHVTPAAVTLAADACAQATVTVDSDFNNSPYGPTPVTVTAAGGGATATRTLDVLIRTVAITEAPGGRIDGGQPMTLQGIADADQSVAVYAVGYGDPPIALGHVDSTPSGSWSLHDVQLFRGSHVRFLAIPEELPVDGDVSRYRATDVVSASRFDSHYEGWTYDDLVTTTNVFRDASEPAWGIGDVGVSGPSGLHRAFDWAGTMAIEDFEVVPTGEPPVSGFTAHGAFAERRYALDPPPLDGVRLTRRYEVGADSRHVRVTDTFDNDEDFDLDLFVLYGSRSALGPQESEYRLSSWDAWQGDGELGDGLDQLTGWPDAPGSGYVAVRSEEPARAATTGHNFVVWHAAPEWVRNGATREDVELYYEVHIEPNSRAQLVHEIGSAPTDAEALALAEQLLDPAPDDGGGDGDGDGTGGDGDGDGTGGDGTGGGGTGGDGTGGTGGDATGRAPGDVAPIVPPGSGPITGPIGPLPPPGTNPLPPRGAPSASLARGARLRTLLRRGLPVAVDLAGARCAPSCVIVADLLLDRGGAARAAAARRLVVARGRMVVTTNGATHVLVRATKRGRRALRRLRRTSLVLRTTVVDGGGRAASSRTRVKLRR